MANAKLPAFDAKQPEKDAKRQPALGVAAAQPSPKSPKPPESPLNKSPRPMSTARLKVFKLLPKTEVDEITRKLNLLNELFVFIRDNKKSDLNRHDHDLATFLIKSLTGKDKMPSMSDLDEHFKNIGSTLSGILTKYKDLFPQEMNDAVKQKIPRM